MIFENFKYPRLLEFFEEISAIPRESYHEDKIADYLVSFAKERGLEYYRDEAQNVLINIDATEGYEDREPILFQGHTDMVCQKNEGVLHDFLTDGLELYVDGGYLRARGTTLGADDGVAVAFMLTLLDGAIEHHPRCQCLFTASEEVGLDGMKAFDFSRIYAKKMINMDGCEDDIIIVGCAGGVRSDVQLPLSFEDINDAKVIKVKLGGLIGGHSGENIGEGRANALRLAAALVNELSGARLVSINGGDKDNAIPREATLAVVVSDPNSAKVTIDAFADKTEKELCELDSGFFVECDIVNIKECKAISAADTKRLSDLISSVQNGVIRMSDKIEGLVEYSRNLGIVATNEKGISLCFSSRSSLEEDLDATQTELSDICKSYGADVHHHSRYPAWTYTGSSALADRYIEAAKRLCGLDVKKIAIHAGLECGIVKEKAPDIEIITCGANARNIHSPAEALELASFERFFEILSDMLADCQ